MVCCLLQDQAGECQCLGVCAPWLKSIASPRPVLDGTSSPERMLCVPRVGFLILRPLPFPITTAVRVSCNLITASGRQVLGESRKDHAAEALPLRCWSCRA
jgi:hypothetical protein